MPKVYYAVTRPVFLGTVESITSPHFGDVTDEIFERQYSYNQLIEIVGQDSNLKLYGSHKTALANSDRVERLENKKDESKFGIGDLFLSYAIPVYGALRMLGAVAGAIRGTEQVKNIYQGIVLKIIINDDTSRHITPIVNGEGEECLGVLPKLQLKNAYSNKDGSQQDWNLRFSTDFNCYLSELHFGMRSFTKLSPLYPKQYANICERNNVPSVVKLLNDYHSPTLGLFLTGHWNRHYKQECMTLVEQIKHLGNTEAMALLWHKREELERSGNCNMNGSYFKRLTYAIEILAPKMFDASNVVRP